MPEKIAGLVVLNALIWAAGAGLLSIVSVEGLRRRLFLAYVVGVAWLGTVGSIVLVAGLSLDRSEIVSIGLAPVAASFCLAWLGRTNRRERLAAASPWWVPAAAVAIAGATLLRSTSQAMGGWDAWSFWTPKAESIIYFDGLSGPFLRSGVANPDYPLLVPVLESSAFRFMGEMDTTLVHVQFALLALAFLGALAEVLAAWASPRRVAIMLVLVAGAPAIYSQTLDAYADVPLAIFTSLGAVLLWQSTEEHDRRRAFLGLLLLGAAMTTKVEGLVFSAAVVFSLAWMCRKRARDAKWLVIGALISAGIAVVPWRLWLLSHDVAGAYHFRFGHLTEHPDRSLDALSVLIADITSPARWLLLPLVVAVAVACGLLYGERRPVTGFVLGAIVLSILGLDLIYWGTPYPYEWHLETSAGRVVTTPLLVAASFSALLLTSPGDVALRRPPESQEARRELSSRERKARSRWMSARSRAPSSKRPLGEEPASPAPVGPTRVT